MDPTGAPSPFDKQNITESAGPARSRTGRFRWQAALKMRAPSMCTLNAAVVRVRADLLEHIHGINRAARHVVRVLDFDQRVGAQCALVGRMAASMSFQCRMPSSVGPPGSGNPKTTPASRAPNRAYARAIPQITSWPCSVCIFTAMVLPMVPVGTNSAGFLADDFGGASLQAIDGGVFADKRRRPLRLPPWRGASRAWGVLQCRFLNRS